MHRKLAQRLFIICLAMTGFAVSFAMAARDNNVSRTSYLSGDVFTCKNGDEAVCNIINLEEIAQ